MDKITDKIAALAPGTNYFSLEFFPPKTQAGFANLQGRLSRMSQALRPLFVTVTWGAGGSTATKSLELAEVCQRQLGVTTCLHLTCTNMNRALVDEALLEAKALGLRNILALRGDPPRSEEYHVDDQEDSNKDFSWAVDLVKYIRKIHGTYFCIGVAGYPEGHADESHPEHQSVERDLPWLVEKVAAGADFIMTQLTYDLDAYARYEKTLRSHPSGLFKTIPIIPGLMPIQSYQIIKRITKLSHATIPPSIMARIEAVKSDDEVVKQVGVDIVSEIVEGMKALPQPHGLPRGLHFYTLNLEKSVAFILERCNLIPMSIEATPSESSDSDNAVFSEEYSTQPLTPNGTFATIPQGQIPRFSRRRASSINAQPRNRLIISQPSISKSHSRNGTSAGKSNSSETHEAWDRNAGVPAATPNRKTSLQISEGQGALGREATWDDFPNGRWGPSHSPAFGEIDGYGSSSLKVGPAGARRIWGRPTTRADVGELFKKVVKGEIGGLPWSDDVATEGQGAGEHDVGSNGAGGGALRKETETIRNELLGLIEKKGYWTLASQPAVNGAPSDDEVFGWGPRGEGFVFQKAFVEFFVSRADWEGSGSDGNGGLRRRLLELGEDEVSWLKTDAAGRFESSDMVNHLAEMEKRGTGGEYRASNKFGGGGVNAVTWGVFRGKEIITPTIIEEQSFTAWGEEAFGIWDEWRRVFPRNSVEDKFLGSCRDDVVLVNVVGQKFVGPDRTRLWELLLA